MSQSPKVPREEYLEQMKSEMEVYLASVMDAVNQAADGEWVAGSEERVRDLSAEFRRQAFERALQMRVDRAEASFPPSAQPGDGQTAGQ